MISHHSLGNQYFIWTGIKLRSGKAGCRLVIYLKKIIIILVLTIFFFNKKQVSWPFHYSRIFDNLKNKRWCLCSRLCHHVGIIWIVRLWYALCWSFFNCFFPSLLPSLCWAVSVDAYFFPCLGLHPCLACLNWFLSMLKEGQLFCDLQRILLFYPDKGIKKKKRKTEDIENPHIFTSTHLCTQHHNKVEEKKSVWQHIH